MVYSSSWYIRHSRLVAIVVVSPSWSLRHHGRFAIVVVSPSWSLRHRGRFAIVVASPSFRSDVCPVSIRRVSCFDQMCDPFDPTCVQFRSDVCPVSIRRVSCFDQTSRLLNLAYRLVSAANLGSSRPVSSARLGSSSRLISAQLVGLAHRLVSACSSRLIGSSRLFSSRLGRLISVRRLGSRNWVALRLFVSQVALRGFDVLPAFSLFGKQHCVLRLGQFFGTRTS